MNILKKIGLGLIAVVVFLAVVGLLAFPRITEVKRSLTMQAPADLIFDQVNNLKKNEAWSPWKDPSMKISYGLITEGPGARSSWVSKKMGNGTMTIRDIVPNSSINIDLDFGSRGKPKVLWIFVSEGEGVKVFEMMSEDTGFNPLKRWMSLITQRVVGPAFEKGLASLKEVVETQAAALKVEQAKTQEASVAPAD